MIQPISITAISSISPLGTTLEEVWSSYLEKDHFLGLMRTSNAQEWVSALSEKSKRDIDELRLSDSKFKELDGSVLFAIYASRNAVRLAGWKASDSFGVNMGSSRGATALFEKYHSEFLKNSRASTLTSPTTTLGNISSWVAHDLGSNGPEISHSITCSTALHALLNGVAWINSGMTDKFLVGGSEAPLTPFTIAQMKALKIYADSKTTTNDPLYPCRALDLDKKRNSMVLGEGASVACLEKGISENAIALIEGVGYATEPLEHNVSISSQADCFQDSMKMALGNLSPADVDAIVIHAPGTVKGDLSEHKAIQKVFGTDLPALTTNKWKVGHTFGASGMLSVELGVLMIKHQKFIGVPFVEQKSEPKSIINRVMVNAVGFGGNAVSVLLKIPTRNLESK